MLSYTQRLLNEWRNRAEIAEARVKQLEGWNENQRQIIKVYADKACSPPSAEQQYSLSVTGSPEQLRATVKGFAFATAFPVTSVREAREEARKRILAQRAKTSPADVYAETFWL